MDVDYILDSLSREMYGMGRYAVSSYSVLKGKVTINPIEYEKNKSKLPSILYYIHNLFFVKNRLQKNSIKHFTSQGMAYMLNYIKTDKVVVTCHDLAPYVFIDTYGYSAIKKYLIRSCMKGLKKADRIIAVSEFTKAELMKHLNIPEEKISVAYDAVDKDRYKPLERNEETAKKYGIDTSFTNILYVGCEEPRMNLGLLIKAVYKLKQTRKDIRLIKVGSPGYPGAREKLTKLIKELNLTDSVIFTGYVDEKDMPQIYNLCDIFVYPVSYAGFGLPPLESMSCGCPTIVADTPLSSEVVGDAAIKFNLNSENELAEKISEVLTNESMRKKLAEAGPKQSSKFTWEKCAESIIKTYESVQ